MRSELLRNALLVSQAVDTEKISTFVFEKADSGHAEFVQLQDQLRRLSSTIRMSWSPANEYVSIYTMKQLNGQVVLGPESIPLNHPLASLPGTVYRQPTKALDDVFDRSTPVVVGPFSDEYGRFVSAFVPLISKSGQPTGVVIGLDIIASDWFLAKLFRAADAIIPFIVFGLAVLYIRRTNHMLKRLLAEKQKVEAQIRELAFFDPLTRLANRRLLEDRVDRAFSAARRSGNHVALLLLDLDNFKPLNDRYGHAVGDRFLVQVANRLTQCVRDVDTVARFGGDEFVVLLGELDSDYRKAHEQAAVVANKILAILREPYRFTTEDNGARIEHCCTACIGVAIFDGVTDGSDVMRRADAAMYKGKASGRDQVVFCDNVSATGEYEQRDISCGAKA